MKAWLFLLALIALGFAFGWSWATLAHRNCTTTCEDWGDARSFGP